VKSLYDASRGSGATIMAWLTAALEIHPEDSNKAFG